MVARRRLKRPPRRSAHLATHRARVSLAEAAGIERVTPRVDEDVAHMRDEIERANEDERAHGHAASHGLPPPVEAAEDDGDADGDDTEVEGEMGGMGRKVIGR
jgi:hypothetical protein